MNLDDCGKGPCLEHGVPRSDVGSTVDPKIETLNTGLRRRPQGGALDPRGDRSHRERWLASGWCGPTIEGDSRPHGRWAPERSPLRDGQPRSSCLSWKRALGLDPEVVAPDRFVDHVSITDQGDAGGARPAPSRTSSGGNDFQVGQLGSSVFRGRPARRRPGSTLVANTKALRSGVRFRCPRRSTPSDCSDGLLPDYSVRRRIAHRRDAWSGSEPGKPPPEGRRPPKRSGAALAAEAACPP